MIKTQCVVVRGNLNALRYSNGILTPVCIPNLQNNGRMRLIHDGASSHTTRATRALLQANQINVLPWPSLSPDLTPIEHILDVIGQRVRSRVPLNVEEWNGVKKLHCIYAEPLPSSSERQWRSHQILNSDDIVTLLITKCLT